MPPAARTHQLLIALAAGVLTASAQTTTVAPAVVDGEAPDRNTFSSAYLLIVIVAGCCLGVVALGGLIACIIRHRNRRKLREVRVVKNGHVTIDMNASSPGSGSTAADSATLRTATTGGVSSITPDGGVSRKASNVSSWVSQTPDEDTVSVEAVPAAYDEVEAFGTPK